MAGELLEHKHRAPCALPNQDVLYFEVSIFDPGNLGATGSFGFIVVDSGEWK